MQILGIEPKTPTGKNGEPSRNLAFVHIEIDGATYRIPIRRNRRKPHLPLPLMGHPDAKAIEAQAADYFAQYELSHVKAD